MPIDPHRTSMRPPTAPPRRPRPVGSDQPAESLPADPVEPLPDDEREPAEQAAEPTSPAERAD